MAHPGVVVIVDGDRNEVIRRDRAADLPAHEAFAEGPHGRVAIVRVVIHEQGNGLLHLNEYGPAGELVRTRTVLRRQESP